VTKAFKKFQQISADAVEVADFRALSLRPVLSAILPKKSPKVAHGFLATPKSVIVAAGQTQKLPWTPTPPKDAPKKTVVSQNPKASGAGPQVGAHRPHAAASVQSRPRKPLLCGLCAPVSCAPSVLSPFLNSQIKKRGLSCRKTLDNLYTYWYYLSCYRKRITFQHPPSRANSFPPQRLFPDLCVVFQKSSTPLESSKSKLFPAKTTRGRYSKFNRRDVRSKFSPKRKNGSPQVTFRMKHLPKVYQNKGL